MELKKQEKDLDAICDRIGETTYYIEDLQKEENVLEGYLADIERMESFLEEKKQEGYSMFYTLHAIDTSYEEKPGDFSNLLFSIFQKYEKESESEQDELHKLENERAKMTKEVNDFAEEEVVLKEKEEKYKERQKTCLAWEISVILMMAMAIGVFAFMGMHYEFSYKIGISFCILIGAFLLLIVLQFKGRMKKKIVFIQRRLERICQYQEHLTERLTQNSFLKTALEYKYGIKNSQEFEHLLEQYKEIEQNVELEQIAEEKKRISDILLEYGFFYPEIFVNDPYSFVEHVERKQMKNYFELRKKQIKKHLLWQKERQEKYILEMNKIITKYPQLKTYAENMLEDYGLKIE